MSVHNLHYEKHADGTVKCIEDEIPFELPEGWEWAPLSQLYNFIDYRGATPNKTPTGVPLVTAKNVKRGFIDYSIDEYISEEEYLTRQQRGVSRKGDILFTTEAPLGNVALADLEKFSAGQRLITFQQYGDGDELCNQLFVFFLLSEVFQHQLLIRKTGSTVTGIKASILKTLILPVPPCGEQQRIAQNCLGMMKLVNEIETGEREIQSLVSEIKATILDMAIRGKLVPQNPNDEPASALLDRICAKKEELVKQRKIKRDKRESTIFRGDDNSYYERVGTEIVDITEELPFPIPETWCWARMSTLFEINPRNKLDDSLEVSFIPMPLIEDGYSGNHGSEKRKWSEVRTGFTHFAEGDIGIAKITPCFENRKSVVFQNLTNGFGAGTTELHVLRPYGKLILPEYALALVKTKSFIEDGKQEFTGAVGQQRIGKDFISEYLFPIPPYQEQIRIVNAIEQVFHIISVIDQSIG